MKTIEVYTDGACFPNPGFGAWAFVEKTGPRSIGYYQSGTEPDTTCNRMEYTAAIKAIEYFDDAERMTIFTDSMLLVRCGNRTARSQKKNLDLVERLNLLTMQRPISFVWVRGHSGIWHNEMADQHAQMALVRSTDVDFLTDMAKNR